MKKILLATILFASCKPPSNNQVVVLEPKDSLLLTGLNDNRDFHNMAFLNDSNLIAFTNRIKSVSTYKMLTKNFFTFTSKDSIQDTSNLNTFFIDSISHSPNFISSDNIWYKLESTKKLKQFTEINLNLSMLLKNEYQFFSVHQQPVIVSDSSILMQIAFKGDAGFYKWFQEPSSFAHIIYNNNGISKIDKIGRKPKDLKDHIGYLELYCKSKNKLVFIYPCVDSIFEYDLNTKEYKSSFISNSSFVKPKQKIDQDKLLEDSEYASKARLESFTYTGIFYSPRTDHYILYFVPPVSDTIKVPTFDDQELFALILDNNYKSLKTVKFKQTYRSTLSFLPSYEGIYMPLYKKSKNANDTAKFHLFDL